MMEVQMEKRKERTESEVVVLNGCTEKNKNKRVWQYKQVMKGKRRISVSTQTLLGFHIRTVWEAAFQFQ